MKPVVCNASPLIAMAKAGLLELLPILFYPFYVPRAVLEEIKAGPSDDPIRLQIDSLSWVQQVIIKPPLSPLATWQLGAGESEVIEFARTNNGVSAVLDDYQARKVAVALGIKVYGTLSVLALAKNKGVIDSFQEATSKLVAAGLYVSESLIEAVAKQLNEQV